MNETTASHYGHWEAVLIWIAIYGVFLFFLPFYKKSRCKPTAATLAFFIAFAFEMFGIPMSMYFIAWAFGRRLPEGILWGHTLYPYIGYWGMYICIVMNIIGGLLVIIGWSSIHKNYWRRESGEGRLVTSGIYNYIRHPQYTGFLLITLGLIFEWATIPLLIMWPILCVVYFRLAKKEEKDMIQEFGDEYKAYQKQTGMFLPKIIRH